MGKTGTRSRGGFLGGNVGRRIVGFERGGAKRATYGETLFKDLAVELPRNLGEGFGSHNLEQVLPYYIGWPISRPVSANSAGQIPQCASTAFQCRLGVGGIRNVCYEVPHLQHGYFREGEPMHLDEVMGLSICSRRVHIVPENYI